MTNDNSSPYDILYEPFVVRVVTPPEPEPDAPPPDASLISTASTSSSSSSAFAASLYAQVKQFSRLSLQAQQYFQPQAQQYFQSALDAHVRFQHAQGLGVSLQQGIGSLQHLQQAQGIALQGIGSQHLQQSLNDWQAQKLVEGMLNSRGMIGD